MPPFVTIRAVACEPHARSARASSRSLWPSSAWPRPYARAVSKTVIPASAAAAIVANASSSSRLSPVDMRMQPRPTRSSDAPSHSGRLRTRRVRLRTTKEKPPPKRGRRASMQAISGSPVAVSGITPAVKREDGFAPIGAYAAIGDGRTAALVAADGSVDFLSLPALHAPTTFAALLDPDRGGRFALEPEGRFDIERRYVGRTNVLETTFTTADGSVRVTDSLNLQAGGLLPWTELARRVEGLAGEVSLRWPVEPRFDWGRVEPRIVRRRGTPVAEGAGVQLGVHVWDAGEPEVADGSISSSFTVREGGRALF